MLEGRAVGAQLASRHLLRREALLAEEPDGCALVPSALNQDLEDLALMIDRAPQVHMLAGNSDDHFVEMPAIAWSRTAPPQSPSNRRSEFEYPTANAHVRDVERTLGKQFLNIAIAQSEAQVEPNRVLNHGRRETVPAIGDRIHGLAAYAEPRSGPVGVFLTMPSPRITATRSRWWSCWTPCADVGAAIPRPRGER
jgi:hypothetical protein